MNEAEVRERLRRAVGESNYPAYLSSRVEARLKHPAREHRQPAFRQLQASWLLDIRQTGSLVAALLVVLLIAALVVGVHAWRNGDLLNTRSVPAVQEPAIKRYQAMVSADQQRFALVRLWPEQKAFAEADAPGYNCTAFGDAGCIAAVALANAALQHWLDDLNRSQPPARFATLDAQMRGHLARAISLNNAYVTAYEAKDGKLANTIINPKINSEIDWLEREASDIIASSHGTMESYTGAVRLDREYLLACALCQRLVSQNQVSCQANQTPSCDDEIVTVRLQVEIFQGDLVRYLAPDSLAAKDARLQADLVTADAALDAMESALSAGNQGGLQGSLDGLRQALDRVAADAADIAGSS